MSYYAVTYSNSLSHHGIKGQKWGVRRFRNKDGSLTARGRDRYGIGSGKRGLRLTDKQKRYLKIGAAVAVTGLAAYGVYKSGLLNADIYKKAGDIGGLINTDEILSNIASDHGTSLIKPGSIKEDIIKCNSKYDPSNELFEHNCSHGSLAYCLRRLGFDAVAKPMSSDEKGGISLVEMGAYFRGIRSASKKLHIDGPAQESLSNKLLQMCDGENGAVGILEIRNGSDGHFVNWENDNGAIKIIDSQKPDFPENAWFQLIDKHGFSDFTAARIDNLQINSRRLEEIVEFAK